MKRDQMYRVGNKVLTGMTAEVKKMDKIMNPMVEEPRPKITLQEYIEKYNPAVRRWVSKAGTPMVEIEVLHDVVEGHLCYGDTITQREFDLDRMTLWLKK